jgi:ADP-heptose:LPS heptosyltransferase
MFKHILVPTDGSELSKDTVRRAVSFAKEAGARITAFFAKPEYPVSYYGEGALIDPTTPEKFAELAQKLVAETPYQLILFGGPEDSFCQQIANGLPSHRLVNTQGKLSILESSALLRHCSLVVANDTGLMHVADALGIPSVLIFGPTSRELGCLPHHPLTRVVENTLWCRPCSKNGQAPCIRSKRWCLERTSAERVYDETLRLSRSLLEET